MLESFAEQLVAGILHLAHEHLSNLSELNRMEWIDLILIEDRRYMGFPKFIGYVVSSSELQAVGNNATISQVSGDFLHKLAEWQIQQRGESSPLLDRLMSDYLVRRRNILGSIQVGPILRGGTL